MFPDLPYPAEAMKIVACEGYFDLLGRAADGQIISFAHVPFTGATHEAAYKHAELLSAAMLMAHALCALIEHAQPDGWSAGETDEGTAWNNAFVALGAARGKKLSIDWMPLASDGPR